ncbi:DUF4116 domain-containing protein [Paraburkholderia fungorum]|uniref:DUF4116 domain-containing protein n=1 Tax=Paraburkholderia fungorum TaxID=134537 RepID=UPI000D07909A|nr:DUF4116 domain-containing protein [Paraburkholderia fungorum]PRZ45353.1 uncharacterized protein DUF4116 [Paraburkholderia fungorum]
MENQIPSIDQLIDQEKLSYKFFSKKYSDIIGITDFAEVKTDHLERNQERRQNQIFGKNRETGKWELAAQDIDSETDLSDVWRDLPINENHICLNQGYYTRTLPNKYRDFIAQTDYAHLSQAGESIRNDEDFMLEAIKNNPENAQFTGFKLRLDQDFVAKAIAHGAKTYQPDLSQYPDHDNFIVETSIDDMNSDYTMILFGRSTLLGNVGIYEELETYEAATPTAPTARTLLTTLPQVYNEDIDDDFAFEEVTGRITTIDRSLVSFLEQRDYMYMSQIDSELCHDDDFLIQALESNPDLTLPNELEKEIGDNDTLKYLRSRRLYKKLTPEIKAKYGHKEDEPEQTPKFKI